MDRRGAGRRSQALVIAINAFFQDGKTGSLCITDGQRLGDLRGGKSRHQFDDGFAAERAMGQCRSGDGASKVKALFATDTTFIRLFSDVRINGHEDKLLQCPWFQSTKTPEGICMPSDREIA